MSRQIPWLRVFVEAVAIVASILLAFGIDAWWQTRGEREREQAYLRSLRAELNEVLERTPALEGQRGVALHAVEQLIGQIQGHPRAPSDSLFVWLSLTSLPLTFSPPPGLDDVALGGGTRTLRSPELLLAFAEYRPLFERVRVQEQAAWAVWEQRLQPFLEGRVSRIERLRLGLVGATNAYGELPFGPSSFVPDFDALFAQPALEDMLAERWLRLRAGAEAVEEVISYLRRLVELIDAELEDPT